MDPKTYGWPREDYSRVPYRLYHDRSIYEREQERIFKGPVWSYVGLEAEIPGAGDFRTGYIGDTALRTARCMRW
jgi:anthranilate 1,2-dioxygenase large subunit